MVKPPPLAGVQGEGGAHTQMAGQERNPSLPWIHKGGVREGLGMGGGGFPGFLQAQRGGDSGPRRPARRWQSQPGARTAPKRATWGSSQAGQAAPSHPPRTEGGCVLHAACVAVGIPSLREDGPVCSPPTVQRGGLARPWERSPGPRPSGRRQPAAEAARGVAGHGPAAQACARSPWSPGLSVQPSLTAGLQVSALTGTTGASLLPSREGPCWTPCHRNLRPDCRPQPVATRGRPALLPSTRGNPPRTGGQDTDATRQAD